MTAALLLTVLLLQPAQVELKLLAGGSLRGRIQAIRQGRIHLEHAGKTTACPLASVELIHLRPPAQELPRTAALFLPGGEVLPVQQLLPGGDGRFRVRYQGKLLPALPL